MRSFAVVGAASSIGIRPYDDGTPRHLNNAPHVLRQEGLVHRLHARDYGDVLPPAYADRERPPGRIRNESGVTSYSRSLGHEVARAARDGSFVVVLGGDCSVLLGSLLGMTAVYGDPIGVVYVDAHDDFATPARSTTGSAAAMATSLAVGRIDSPLARLRGDTPLVREEDIVIIGRRDESYATLFGKTDLATSSVLDIPHQVVRDRGVAGAARAALDHFDRSGLRHFWIHVDADVLDPSVMPAVDTPEPGGLSPDELSQLLGPLVADSRAIGLELTIYDPHLDPDRTSARRLVSLLDQVLRHSDSPGAKKNA